MNAIVRFPGTKIAPIVRLLASPVDAEALAACRALDRALRAHRLDIHDLADAIEHAALPAAVPPRPKAPPAPALAPWQILAMRCIRAGSGRLNATELDFLRSMVHWAGAPSERQTRWLCAIASALDLEVP